MAAVNQYGDKLILLADPETSTSLVTGIIVENKVNKENKPSEIQTWSWTSLYVLFLLLWVFVFEELDRNLLKTCTHPMAVDLEFGNMGCIPNNSVSGARDRDVKCDTNRNEYMCVNGNMSTESACMWWYTGEGFEYEMLTGPVFTAGYTILGLFICFCADVGKRKSLLVFSVVGMSLATIFTGLVQNYWQLALMRILLGISLAGCIPSAVALIGDLFMEGYRGLALGVFSWGMVAGYTLAYVFGDVITGADLLGMGWRWAYYCAGIPGFALGVLILVSVKEPERRTRKDEKTTPQALYNDRPRQCGMCAMVLGALFKPSLVIVGLAAAIRNAAGCIWRQNSGLYYDTLISTPEKFEHVLAWIPLLGGAFSALVGGIIADKLAVKSGPKARILVIAISLMLAAPFAAGSLLLSPPTSYYVLLPCYLFGEVWVGVSLAVVIDVVPSALRTTCLAFYVVLVAILGDLGQLLVPVVQNELISAGFRSTDAFRMCLLILFPGGFILSAVTYLMTLCTIKSDVKKMASSVYTPINGIEIEPGGNQPETE